MYELQYREKFILSQFWVLCFYGHSRLGIWIRLFVKHKCYRQKLSCLLLSSWCSFTCLPSCGSFSWATSNLFAHRFHLAIPPFKRILVAGYGVWTHWWHPGNRILNWPLNTWKGTFRGGLAWVRSRIKLAKVSVWENEKAGFVMN